MDGASHVTWAVDEVTLQNPPQEPRPHHPLKVLYSCDEEGASVHLDCVVVFDTGVVSTLRLRRWRCVPGDAKTRTVRLNLPDWLVYQADGIVPDSQWVLSCMLRASLRYSKDEDDEDDEDDVAAQAVADLQPRPFFSRPVKQHQLCFDWSQEMQRLNQGFLRKQCALEKETVRLLSSIFASTGENFGVTRTLSPHSSDVLENLRLKAVLFPWCLISMWIFVSRHCQDTLCGVFHHIDSGNNYITPTLLLTNSGELHIQLSGESGQSSAFLSMFKVPLSEWCQLSLTLQGRTVTLSMLCMGQQQRTAVSKEYELRHTVRLDDTEGYFVIGGGKFVKGVEGYFGPVVYYRHRISHPSESDSVIPDVIRDVNLDTWARTCRAFRLEINTKISGYALHARQSETCPDVFHEWTMKDRRPSQSQCEQWETTVPRRRRAAKLSKILVFKHGGKRVSLSSVGRALFTLSLRKLDSVAAVSRVLPLLLQAGCLSDHRALHMASVLYSSGFGVRKQLNKAWRLSLLAAQDQDRLSLLRLGHLHHQGLHGLPADTDVAYAYYANIAKQTTIDRQNPSPDQKFVEAVYLNNEEALKHQTKENHHLFQWLKHQAGRGVTQAEHAVARMLFWGQQGVAPDISKAVKHYERGAVQWKDPQSMYDYGIVLLQGRGVRKDVPKAVTFLKKAMEQGFVPAFNALAWYYETFEQDYEKAVQLWEQADLLQSPDAALNLGVMYLQGLYPGRAANKFMAYKYYLKAAERGHIRGAFLLAEMWSTGLPGFVDRRPADAVLWVKWASEHNGHLGSVLRKALDSYLIGDVFTSLLYYLMAAESGYTVAQFNVAYICEQNPGSFLYPGFASQCMCRYYNLSLQSQKPDTYAFIKMGDLFYEGQVKGQKDLSAAAEMYKQAALRKQPQGWYNLGLLTEEGYRLPLSLLTELGLSDLFLLDQSLLLSVLYQRCRDSEGTDSYLPCSLALFKVHLQLFQKEHSAAIKISIAVAMVAAPTMFLLIRGAFRRRVLSPSEP
ncbi:sel-1-like 3-like [Solea senegalensis]|uniref:Sel-1-like 3-like n=1 Tax=Solea senegalensis TaxID=28829 RepID=A0AAV6PYN2_SOLSE|nr:sel-1-like 3-like [Solea senegalensis]